MNTPAELVDAIVKDLGPRVSRAWVERMVSEVVPQFEDSTITTYVPIFVNRMIRARLHQGPGQHVALPSPE